MAVKLHRRAETYAKSRISRGKIDYSDEWSLSDDERNALFVEGAERFGEWHLGKDDESDESKVSSYAFAYGKNGKVSRAALDAIVREATKRKKQDPGCADIADAAKELRDLIDRKKANSRRLLFFGPREGRENESDPRKRFEGVIILDTSVVLEDIPDMVEGGGSRGWTQIARTGKFLGHWQGPFTLTEDDLAAMVVNKDRFVNPVLFDYAHESVYNSAAIASGWGHEFKIGKGGDALYSDTEWTRRAADHIRAGEMKYISPVILFETIDPYTGEDLGPSIWTVALLNTPFFDGMDPVEIGAQIAASRQRLNGAPPNRTWAIPTNQSSMEPAAPGDHVVLDGHPVTHDDPAFAGDDTSTSEPPPDDPATGPEATINTSTEDVDMDKKAICAALGLPEDATQEQITAAIAAQKQAADKAATDAKALADQKAAEAKAAQDRVAQLEREKKERELKEAKDLTEAYIKAGRIAPASRERACKMAIEDRESFYALYGKEDEPGRAVVPMGAVASADPASSQISSAPTGAATLTDEDREVMERMKVQLGRVASAQSKRFGRPVGIEEVFLAEKKGRQERKVLGRTFACPDNVIRTDR